MMSERGNLTRALGGTLLMAAALLFVKEYLFGAQIDEPVDTLPALLEEDTEAEMSLAGEPYPPPDPWPTSTPTPEPDENGLLPAPAGVVTQTVTIPESEFAAELQTLKAALDAKDAQALASFVEPEGIQVSGSVKGLALLRPSNAQPTFEQLFQNGSTPVMQGYLHYGCIYLYTTGWVGEADLPEWPLDSPPDFGPLESVSGPTFSWMVCKAGGGQPGIDGWDFGHYHRMVAKGFARVTELYENGTKRYGPVKYYVLAPE